MPGLCPDAAKFTNRDERLSDRFGGVRFSSDGIALLAHTLDGKLIRISSATLPSNPRSWSGAVVSRAANTCTASLQQGKQFLKRIDFMPMPPPLWILRIPPTE